jgi:hypothetical protein
MEYCDRGTLKDAVSSGMFHQKLPSGAIGVDLVAVMDVSCARRWGLGCPEAKQVWEMGAAVLHGTPICARPPHAPTLTHPNALRHP